MAKRAKPEKIIAKLREADIRLSECQSVAKVAKSIGVTEQTYDRRRKEGVKRMAVSRSIRPSG